MDLVSQFEYTFVISCFKDTQGVGGLFGQLRSMHEGKFNRYKMGETHIVMPIPSN